MAGTLLDKISKHPNNTYITDAWLTGQTGEIVDLKNDCIFRFVDYDTEGELRIKHTTEESQLSCPVVACGLVGYWLHKKDSEGTKAIFDGYYQLCLKNYEKEHECDDNAWERDLKKEFVCRHHVPTEKKWLKASEALFPYITESDQKRVKSIMANYLKYARSKRKQLYPPNHPANRIIEDTFLDAYRVGGPAYECMSWMRTEYNLPNTDSYGLSEEGHWRQASGRWKERHDKIIPKYIAEEYEDFDDRVLKYTNGGLMEEIDENFKRCLTQEDRIRYIISLLQPFKDFAEAFDAKARIDERKRSIKEHEKWINDWKAMPDDAVDERTGEPIRPKDQVAACVESIEEYKQDIEYWKKVQQDFYWFAQHGLGAGHYREYPQEVNDEMCKYLGGWWECMIFFARRLAALALTYGIKLMDVQERCEIYLMWHFKITDYVDEKYITSIEHARKLLDEIESKKPKSKTNGNTEPCVEEESKGADNINSGKEETPQKMDSDFEYLKEWQDNSDLDCYLSEGHWNYHVNTLLYKNLLVFHEGKELGAFLDVSDNSFTQPIRDYTPLYGNLFNEAYRLCSKVLTSPVPQAKVAWLANQAATWKFRNVKDEDGNTIEIAPNVTDLIESYHILGMVNAILTISNVQKKAVNEFLIALSVYNDNGMYFCGYTHSFGAYNETYEALILANIVNGTMLHPGYDNISRDKYLRKNVPWYEHLASKLEKEKQKEKDKKTASIQTTNNNDSIVINGPVKDCTFIMSAATPSSKKTVSKKGKKNSSSTTAQKPELQHGVEYPVFSKGAGVTDDHIKALYRLLTARGWIGTQTKEADFLRMFSGKSNDCEIIWTSLDKLGNNKSTKLGISALYVLFKDMFDEGLITTSSKAQKVGPILEMHFVDTDGHFLTNVSNLSTTSAKANDYIQQILRTMKMRPSSEDIQRLLEEDMESKYDENDRQDLNYRKPR